ncbi:hypothetical protein BHE74_00002243 [Ensete ventricosum]|nr:hypothetical protein BHE74_00002243 [Ensete ventricosum]RZR80970.1 hypothetical protein BHM03_00007101 [Ensete ventricosum]
MIRTELSRAVLSILTYGILKYQAVPSQIGGGGEPEGQAAEVGVEQVAEVGVGDDLVIAAVEQPLVYFVPYGVAGGGAAEGPRGRRALALAFLHVGRGAGAPRLGLGSGSGSAHADGPKLGFRMKGKQEEGSPAVKEHWKAAEIPEEEKARREEKRRMFRR